MSATTKRALNGGSAIPVAHEADFTTASSTTDVSSSISVTASMLDEAAYSSFDKVLSLLKGNSPEQRFDIHLSYPEYLKVEETWSKIKADANISEDRSHAETVTVVTIPRSLHEVAPFELRHQTMTGIEAYLISHRPEASGEIIEVGSTTIKMSDGNYAHGVKDADGLFVYSGRGVRDTDTVVFEDMWIQGDHVNACVLICLKESPRFRNPTERYENLQDLAIPDALYYGQIRYKATYGPCENLPSTIGFRVSDFYSNNAWEALGIPDYIIPFNGPNFQRVVFVRLLRECARREELRGGV
ncbi:hypothetical protein V1508DRAFT_401791 [Lipomyces doorenjongii]|uniref:uncharacterized protein n=1 Tax=Lipomyces doorenjongii TaxID=383834 RepID=UPI0034CDD961